MRVYELARIYGTDSTTMRGALYRRFGKVYKSPSHRVSRYLCSILKIEYFFGIRDIENW